MLGIALKIFVSLIVLWIGANLAIRSVEKFSHRIRAKSFAISFLILGFLTSLSELSFGVSSVIDKEPQLFVGNLIGASIVITLLIIPLMAIIGGEVSLKFGDTKHNLPLTLLVISFPVFLVLDNKIDFIDAFFSILLFIVLSISIQRDKGFLAKIEQIENVVNQQKLNYFKDFLRVLLGSLLIIVSSKIIVDNVIHVADLLQISTFLIGLLIIALGTNIPELSILFYSLVNHKKNIALGDYLGSGAYNTFLIGLLTFLNGSPVRIESGLKLNILLLPLGTIVILLISRGKTLNRMWGILLILMYVSFVLSEIYL